MKKLLAKLFAPKPLPLQNIDGEYSLRTSSPLILAPVSRDPHYEGTVQQLKIVRPKLTKLEPLAAELQMDVQTLKKLFKSSKGYNKRIDILKVCPSFAKKYNNKYSPVHGPNCWNACLNWHDDDVGVKHTTSVEMMRRLGSAYEVIAEDQLRFGDVIAFWRNTGLEHTAIYLNNKYVWHKGGASEQRPWTLESFDTVARTYYYSKEIDRVTFHKAKG